MKTAEIQSLSVRTLNLIIGAIALMLGPVLMLVGNMTRGFIHSGSEVICDSVSAYYHFNDITRNLFVGGLTAIGMLLLAYRGWFPGRQVWDRLIGVLGCLLAIAIANIPCCSDYAKWHNAAAVVLFLILGCMLMWRFTERTGDAQELQHPEWKKMRNTVYRLCAIAMLAALLLRGLSTALGGTFFSVMAVELVCLTAFGIGWLVKSRYILGYGDSKLSLFRRNSDLEDSVGHLLNKPLMRSLARVR